MTNDNQTLTNAADIEFEELWVYWVEEHDLSPVTAKWLAFYQYTGGNAFRLTDLSNRINFAPRGTA